MATYTTRDGLMEVEVSEMDIVEAVDFKRQPDDQLPVVDYIILTVKSPETDTLTLKLEFDPQAAIDLGKDIAKQGRSAKRD